MTYHMTLIPSPPDDPRPRFRGTGWNQEPGGVTIVPSDTLAAWVSDSHLSAYRENGWAMVFGRMIRCWSLPKSPAELQRILETLAATATAWSW